MSGYQTTDRDRVVSAELLVSTVRPIFERRGMLPDDAALLTDSLVLADLRGVHSHGVLRVAEYAEKLRTGGVDPRGRPFVARDGGAALVVDGANSMGQIGSRFAMGLAVERAQSTGVAAAAVRGSNHCGALGYYAQLDLDRDTIGLATTNALPTMAAWGGVDKIVGINPLALAIPAGAEPPLVFDAAFSGSAHGKIRVYAQKGLPIPNGWAFDQDGHPTTDATAALDGLLQPIGGFKGTGLAIMMGVLSSVLSGAAYGTELGNMVDGPRPGQDGHFFLAIKVAAFEDPARFKARVDGIIRRIRASRRAPGVERVYAPGELEWETERRYRRDGIPLPEATLHDVARTATDLGIDHGLPI